MPGKTGLFDESLLIDFELRPAPFLDTLVTGRDPKAPLWTFSQLELSADFMNAVRDLGIDVLRPSLYSNRHGGASEDLLSRRRPVDEVKKRGRWRSDASLRRYGKETRLLSEMLKVPVATINYGLNIQQSLEWYFHHPDLVPVEPPAPAAPLLQ